jgi:hypothetical protein
MIDAAPAGTPVPELVKATNIANLARFHGLRRLQ